MRALTLKALELAQPDLDEAAREEMVAAPAHDFGPSHHVTKLADVASGILRRLPEDRETDLLFDILRKMDRQVSVHVLRSHLRNFAKRWDSEEVENFLDGLQDYVLQDLDPGTCVFMIAELAATIPAVVYASL